MPYTKEELQDVDFYREFVDKLRYTYLDRMSESAATFFRDRTGALISYEDIETGLGIEDATFDLNGVYSTLMSALGGPELPTILGNLNQSVADWLEENIDPSLEPGTAAYMQAVWANGGLPEIQTIDDVPAYIRTLSTTITNEKLPKYLKTNNLESIIDRNITELAEDLYADELPEGMANGDVVKNAIAEDTRKWRIEGNQKRIFLSLSAFFGNGHIRNDLKTFKMSILKKIPNGDPIE